MPNTKRQIVKRIEDEGLKALLSCCHSSLSESAHDVAPAALLPPDIVDIYRGQRCLEFF
jgi:hypothetical protein